MFRLDRKTFIGVHRALQDKRVCRVHKFFFQGSCVINIVVGLSRDYCRPHSTSHLAVSLNRLIFFPFSTHNAHLQVGDPPVPAARVGQPDAAAATRLGTAAAFRGGGRLGGPLEMAAIRLGRGRASPLFRSTSTKVGLRLCFVPFRQIHGIYIHAVECIFVPKLLCAHAHACANYVPHVCEVLKPACVADPVFFCVPIHHPSHDPDLVSSMCSRSCIDHPTCIAYPISIISHVSQILHRSPHTRRRSCIHHLTC